MIVISTGRKPAMISTWYSQKKNLEILHILSLEKAQDSQELVEISPPEIHWISGTGYDIFTSHVPSSHHHETQKKVPFPKKSHQPFLRNKKALNKGCLHHWLSLNDPLRQTALQIPSSPLGCPGQRPSRVCCCPHPRMTHPTSCGASKKEPSCCNISSESCKICKTSTSIEE